jgi:hypothetical protein
MLTVTPIDVARMDIGTLPAMLSVPMMLAVPDDDGPDGVTGVEGEGEEGDVAELPHAGAVIAATIAPRTARRIGSSRVHYLPLARVGADECATARFVA